MPKYRQITSKLKHDIIYWWLTKGGFLRRIGKKYPEFFEKHFVRDYTDNPTEKKIMLMRYAEEHKTKFEAIAIVLGITERYVYELHKKVVDRIISG